MLPGIVERAAAPHLAGRLDVASARCAWFGPQRLTGVRVLDPDGEVLAQLEIDVAGPLVPLAMGSTAYGTVHVRGSATLVHHSDGTTNLERTLAPLLEPDPPGAPAPDPLPAETDIDLRIETLAVRVVDGKTGREAHAEPVRGRVIVSYATPIEVELQVAPVIDSPAITSDPASIDLAGKVEGWTDASGRFDAAHARVDLTGRVSGVPGTWIDTALGLASPSPENGIVDSTLRVVGTADRFKAEASLQAPTTLLSGAMLPPDRASLLTDLLGPTASADLHADIRSAADTTLTLDARSDHASVSISGTATDSVFVLDQPATLTIATIGPALGDRVFGAMPLIGSIQKRQGDPPASVTIDSLTWPVQGGLGALDSSISIDLGTATFQASRAFEPLLELASWQVGGTIGDGLGPIRLTIRQGVLELDSLAVPIGEYTIRTRGRVDLASRTRDLVIDIPVGALAQDFVDGLEGDLGAAMRRDRASPLGGVLGRTLPTLDELTTVPFRITGSLDEQPRPRPDLEMMLRGLVEERLSPDRIIQDGLRGILEGLPRRRSNDDDGPGNP